MGVSICLKERSADPRRLRLLFYSPITAKAKSLRSKWKRKMRDVKRERYAKKELVKLKECAARLQQTKDSCSSAADLADNSLYQLVSPASLTKEKVGSSVAALGMDVEMNDSVSGKTTTTTTTKLFGKTDKNGQYPVWMSQRNVKRLQKKNGKKKVEKKRNKSQN